MGVTTSNLLMGPATLFTGLVGATEPASNATALGTPWTDAGGTQGGATLTISQNYAPMEVDQLGMAAGARRTKVGVKVATNLAEATLANLRVALNAGPDPAVSPALPATFYEIDAEIGNTDPLYQAVCLQGIKPGGGPRRIFIRRTLSTEDIGIPFQKDGMTLVPVTFDAYYVSSSVKAARIDDTP